MSATATKPHNERLAKRRNEKRLLALQAQDIGPCGYCGIQTKGELCPKHVHLAGAYREDDDRQRETNDED